MNRRNLQPIQPARGRAGGARKRAFTLIELLVVIAIIAILAGIGLPAMKGIRQANVLASANRQLLDDIAYARLRALSDRTTVYMVFSPTNLAGFLSAYNSGTPEGNRDLRILTNLASRPYMSYALISKRSVGDQPGRGQPRYITEWKALPEGVLIPPYKFARRAVNPNVNYPMGVPFQYTNNLPFPSTLSNPSARKFQLPFIAFNSQGQLLRADGQVLGRDEILPLVRGTIFPARNALGHVDPTRLPDVQILPPNVERQQTGLRDFQVVRVNWLTGRGKVEGQEFAATP